MSYQRQRGMYRARGGVLLGVCQGIATYFDMSVFWVRMIWVIAFILTGLWPVAGVYVVCALLLKPEPVRPLASDDDKEFYDSYAASPRNAAGRLKRKFDHLDRRIRRMEDQVTGRDFEWERKFRQEN
ncbi:MAG: envelope stress response membrane protein PspC [Desulfobulbaceae bacterium]|jgi:phage shock protein C|nr:envelope stress response membrane protein PspC [Desulfobulbaceae bacterium]